MLIFSKYFLFISLGVIITFIPVLFKLRKQKKYGLMTFVVILTMVVSVTAVYYVLKKLYLDYF